LKRGRLGHVGDLDGNRAGVDISVRVLGPTTAVLLNQPFASTGKVIFQLDNSKLPLGATEEFKAMI
jgi:hypothetical protein